MTNAVFKSASIHDIKENLFPGGSSINSFSLPSNCSSLSSDSSNSIEISSNPYSQPQDPIVNYIEHYRNVFSNPDNFLKRRVDYGRMKVFDEKYRKELERSSSFTNFPSNLKHLISSMAKSGFYYVGNEEQVDKVKCIFCQGTLSKWKKTDVPSKEHKKSFPTCPFILNLNVGNEPLKDDFPKISQVDPVLNEHNGPILYNVIKSECFTSLDMPQIFPGNDCDWRENTFVGKWENLRHLALHGLYMKKAGIYDYVACYSCKKSTQLLQGAECLKISIFHKITCELITEFSCDNSQGMSAKTKMNNKLKFCKVEYSITEEEIEARLDSRVANEIATIVDKKNNIKLLIANKLKSTGKDYDSIVDLLYDYETNKMNVSEIDNYDGHHDENPYVYAMQDYLCVVCMDNPSQVVYLPCGHFKTCRICSNSLKSCPVCRKLIERRVYDIRFNLTEKT